MEVAAAGRTNLMDDLFGLDDRGRHPLGRMDGPSLAEDRGARANALECGEIGGGEGARVAAPSIDVVHEHRGRKRQDGIERNRISGYDKAIEFEPLGRAQDVVKRGSLVGLKHGARPRYR